MNDRNNSSADSRDEPDGPCFYCGEVTSSYAGDPGRWPLRFCQRDGTGITRYHHTRCVTDRIHGVAQPASGLEPYHPKDFDGHIETLAQAVGMLGRENDAFHRTLRKYPDAFEALHSFWNDAFASQPSPAATVATKSAPVLIASHQSEGLPSSDAAGAGADTHLSAGNESAAVADQIIGQIEDRFPDWRSYRDLIDCIDCTLHRLREDVRHDVTRDEPQTLPVPDLLATTISACGANITIQCNSTGDRDAIYDWIMNAACSLTRPHGGGK